MKKIGLLALLLVFALGSLGVGYALWSETLTIDATVNTGDVDISYVVACNDTGLDPTDPTADPAKDVATCTVTDGSGTGSGTVAVTLDDAYPGYNPELRIDVTNRGSIPVHLYVYLHFKQDTWVSDDCGVTWKFYELCDVLRMVAGQDYHFDFDMPGPPDGPEDTDLDVWCGIDCTQLEENVTVSSMLKIKVKQDADENATYRFNIIIVAQQWNEAAQAPTPTP